MVSVANLVALLLLLAAIIYYVLLTAVYFVKFLCDLGVQTTVYSYCCSLPLCCEIYGQILFLCLVQTVSIFRDLSVYVLLCCLLSCSTAAAAAAATAAVGPVTAATKLRLFL